MEGSIAGCGTDGRSEELYCHSPLLRFVGWAVEWVEKGFLARGHNKEKETSSMVCVTPSKAREYHPRKRIGRYSVLAVLAGRLTGQSSATSEAVSYAGQQIPGHNCVTALGNPGAPHFHPNNRKYSIVAVNDVA